MKKMKTGLALMLSLLLFAAVLSGCSMKSDPDAAPSAASSEAASGSGSGTGTLSADEFSYEALPEYSGEPYTVVNNNEPYFTEDEITDEAFESYGKLDSLGRCTAATACLGRETMPAYGEERDDIYMIKPTGWRQARYDCVDGESVLTRAHLIAWFLSAEDQNERNLVSGTRYMNLEMLAFENLAGDYIKETNNHVMYRVTPVFIGNELLCRGLLMEGYSVEDKGKAVSYNVFFYNVQPGIDFDYQTGKSWYTGVFLDMDSEAVNYDAVDTYSSASSASESGAAAENYVLNLKSKKFHRPDCEGVADMNQSNRKDYYGDRETLIDQGYSPCPICDP